jgi:hypothetical protein
MEEQNNHVTNNTKKFTYFPLASISATPTTALFDLISMPFRGTYHLVRKCQKTH